MTNETGYPNSTQSLCPVCLKRIPARREAAEGDVFLVKDCPEHGGFRSVIWRGEPSWESWVRPKTPAQIEVPLTEEIKGCPFDCGLCPAHRQHTCTALLEVTDRCNLHCSFCFAGSDGPSIDPSLGTVRGWYQRLLDSGGPCNIQLSGGEPTLRDDLPQLVALGRCMGFSFIQLNTNGLRLARDPRFLESLAKAGLSSVFLQFDGTQGDIHRRLRGGDFLAEKLAAVRRCGELGIGVVLVPTVVPEVNDRNLGELVDLALQLLPVVRGVHFQPVSYFGRFPEAGAPAEAGRDRMRITLPEIMAGLERQTAGRIRKEHFRPPGCENALCSFHGNFVLMPGGDMVATTRHAPCCGPLPAAGEGAARTRGFVSTRWAASPGEGCGGTVKDSLDLFLARARTHALSISGMAFQDAWTIDLERLRDCCIHTVAPDGRIIPFCAYNLTGSAGRPLYRC
ncbi:MAG TPA: radical SAM protein [Spirochaetia bacterium]|nr:radical SAM protein [Spirochaetia bacterium]